MFDAKHQVLSVDGVASYAYDAAGRRVKKGPDGSGPSQGSFYSQSGELMVGYDEATGQYTDYLYPGGRLIARRKGGTSFSQLYATGTYQFRVKACNSAGCSGWSGYATVNVTGDL